MVLCADIIIELLKTIGYVAPCQEPLRFPKMVRLHGVIDDPPPPEPAGPVAPIAPVCPVAPVEPVAPTDPAIPVGPVAPIEPATPVGPAEPATPAEPVDPTEPATPVGPVGPIEPATPAPVGHTEPVGPLKIAGFAAMKASTIGVNAVLNAGIKLPFSSTNEVRI